VKITKEFVWIIVFPLLNLAFGQVGGKKIKAKTAVKDQHQKLCVQAHTQLLII
jgi:hypothetical protein